MPSLLKHRIRIMKNCQRVQLLCIISIMFSGGVLLQCFFEKSILPNAALFLTAILCISTCSMAVSIHYIKQKSGNFEPYCIPIETNDIQSIITNLSANCISQDTYVSLGTRSNIKIRTLIMYIPSFDEAEVRKKKKVANKVINKQHAVPKRESYFDAVSRLRINLLICDQYSEQLCSWLNRGRADAIRRNESIVSAAIILNEDILLYPAFISSELDLKQVKKYELAANWLIGLLRDT